MFPSFLVPSSYYLGSRKSSSQVQKMVLPKQNNPKTANIVCALSKGNGVEKRLFHLVTVWKCSSGL